MSSYDTPQPAMWPERFAVAILALLLMALALAFVRQTLPFVLYPYEADPSDGDMLNAALRALAGEPIYGDWKAGDVTLLYPPLFLGILALGRMLRADPVVFFRVVNLGLFLVSVALVVILASAREDRRVRISLLGLLAGLLLFSAWKQLLWIAPLHPAVLLLCVSLATCTVIVFRPSATTAVAVGSVLAVLTKQSGIALLAALAIHFATANRKRLPRFLAVATIVAGLAVAGFEIQSQGQFLRAVVLYPSRALTGPWLRWDNLLALVTGFYRGRLWLLPVIAAGLVVALRSTLRPLAVLFLVDATVEVQLGRSLAGSASYLWLHFALACVLAAVGWDRLLVLAASRLRIFARPLAAPTLTMMLGLACFVGDGRNLLMVPAPDLSMAAQVSKQHSQLVARIVAAHPGEKWVAMRSSLALVRAGVLLDQEYSTFAIALSHPTLIDHAAIGRRFASGEYRFAQLAPTAVGFDPLAEVFAACFVPEARSTLIFLGRTSPTMILRYDGTGPACRRLREP